jgi:hypothetical protein
MSDITPLEPMAALAESRFCETPTARDIMTVLALTQAEPDRGIAWIIGDAGVGKTTAAKAYREHNPFVYIARLRASSQSRKFVMKPVADEIGAPFQRQADDAFDCVVLRLRDLADRAVDEAERAGNNIVGWPLLIIDEIQHATDEALEYLRDLYDEMNDDGPLFAMAWFGNDDARSRFREGSKDKRFAPIYRRRGEWRNFEGASDDDIESLCRHYGIVRPELIRVLTPAAENEGLGGVYQAIKRAKQIAASEKRAVLLEHVRKAIAERSVND